MSLLSKSLDPALFTTTSQEYTEQVQLISMARMASVANTLPCIYQLLNDRVICGGDNVEDALDAPQRLLCVVMPSKVLLLLLQCATAPDVSRL